MKIKELVLGLKGSGAFKLPLDAVTETFAVMGIRGSGKTSLVKVMAEQMCLAGLAPIIFDPVGIWWGLRANRDGTPGGYPAVVIGGEHADLPLEKHAGEKIAEALTDENVPCVIDVSGNSKNEWRRFLTDFCDALMRLTPREPRHLIIEEAPEFVPQRPMGEQKRSLAAVDRLVRLGRNRGYGCTLITQRPATVHKDVLSQCANLFILRTGGKHDRKALQEWTEVAQADVSGDMLNSLAKLKTGNAWFWSPAWLDNFELVEIAPYRTFHPGETRRVGKRVKAAELSDVEGFAERLRVRLSRSSKSPASGAITETAVTDSRVTVNPRVVELEDQLMQLEAENKRQRAEIEPARQRAAELERKFAAAKESLGPLYQALDSFMSEAPAAGRAQGNIDPKVYDVWIRKLNSGPRKLLKCLIERGGRATRPQLGTLTGIAHTGKHFQNCLSNLRTRGLIRDDGDAVLLQEV